jgi:hypothetical protein
MQKFTLVELKILECPSNDTIERVKAGDIDLGIAME